MFGRELGGLTWIHFHLSACKKHKHQATSDGSSDVSNRFPHSFEFNRLCPQEAVGFVEETPTAQPESVIVITARPPLGLRAPFWPFLVIL